MSLRTFGLLIALFLLAVTGPWALADDAPGQVEIRTSLGTIVVELDPTDAPRTSSAFVSYIRQHVYDGSSFYNVGPHGIQGGKPGPRAVGFSSNGNFVPNPPAGEFTLKHTRGMMGMARTVGDCNPSKSSNSTTFYILNTDGPEYDGQYSLFGHVVQGMDVVDKIDAVLARDKNTPISFNVVIASSDAASN